MEYVFLMHKKGKGKNRLFYVKKKRSFFLDSLSSSIELTVRR